MHGHAGWLSAAALLHPAILLRKARRRAHLAVGLAVGFVTATGALGVYLYEPYRDRVKQGLFIASPGVGYLFERKEHLAFGAIVLAWAGGIAYAAAAARATEERLREPLRAFAWRAFVIACALTTVVAALGVVVAVTRTF